MEKKIILGNVERDPYGSWDDCSPGLYLNRDLLETIFNKYEGKKIRVTIEEIVEDDGPIVNFRLRDIVENDEAIKFLGLNPWCLNEGSSENETYQIPLKLAKKFGLV